MSDEKKNQLAVIGDVAEKTSEESTPESVDQKKKKMKMLYTGEGRADILAMLDELPPEQPKKNVIKDPNVNLVEIFFQNDRTKEGRPIRHTFTDMLKRANQWGKYIGQRGAFALEDKRNAMRALSVEVDPKVNGVLKSPTGDLAADEKPAPRFPEDETPARSIVAAKLIPVQEQNREVFDRVAKKYLEGDYFVGPRTGDREAAASDEPGKKSSIFELKVAASFEPRPEEMEVDKFFATPNPATHRWVLDHAGQKSHAEIGREAALRKAREKSRDESEKLMRTERAARDTNLLLSSLTQPKGDADAPKAAGKSPKVKDDDQR